MAKKFNMVSELFPPLVANMASRGSHVPGSRDYNRAGDTTGNHSNQNQRPPPLHRSRTQNLDEFSPIYFSHNLSIRLNDHNFLLWKQQVMAAIRGNRLYSYITNDHPPQFLTEQDQHSKTFDPSYLDWEVQDQLLMSWLLSSMSESLLTRMVGCETSKQIWSKLEQYFT
ncbi:hypothetical protein CsatB_009054 [Cannabis sativa]